MRYRIYQDARFAGGAVAAGRTITVYDDSAGATESTIYTTATGAAEASNPYTIPATGIIDFWATTPRPWGLAQGDSTVRPLRVIGSDHALNILDYGAVGDGATDDSAAIQSAVDAASGGGTIIFPPGRSYLVSTLIAAPVGLDGRLTLSGYGATIVCGSGGFVRFNNTAPHDVFQHMLFEGFHIDAGGLGATRAVFGNRNLTVTNVCFHDLTFRDLYIYDMPTGNAAEFRCGIGLACWQSGAGEDTQDYFTDIVFDNVVQHGGDCCVYINGTAYPVGTGDHTNIWVDNIVLRDCHHDRGQYDGVGYVTNSFHIGGKVYGGTCRIENCSSSGAVDCGFEANGFRQTDFVDCDALESKVVGFLFVNFNDRVDIPSQIVNLRGCNVHAAGMTGYGYAFHGLARGVGTVSMEGCSVHSEDTALIGSPPNPIFFYTSSDRYGPLKLVMRDCAFSYTGWTTTDATPGIYAGRHEGLELTHGPSEVVLENVLFYFSGTHAGSGSLTLRCLYLTTPNLRLDIDGLRVKTAITCTGGGTSDYRIIAVGNNTTTQTVSGSARRIVMDDSDENTNPIVLWFYGSALTVDGFSIDDCDWRNLNGDTNRVYCTVAANKQKVRERNCLYATAPTPAAITPSGSPYTYTNADLYDEFVVVSGGTVSAIELSTNAGTTFTNVGATAGSWLLRSGDQLKVTYSSDPTMAKVPKP